MPCHYDISGNITVVGGKLFGAIGTCWGSYMVLRESAYPEVTHREGNLKFKR